MPRGATRLDAERTALSDSLSGEVFSSLAISAPSSSYASVVWCSTAPGPSLSGGAGNRRCAAPPAFPHCAGSRPSTVPRQVSSATAISFSPWNWASTPNPRRASISQLSHNR